MASKQCSTCRYYKRETGMFGGTKDYGKCELTKEKVYWNTSCTRWAPK